MLVGRLRLPASPADLECSVVTMVNAFQKIYSVMIKKTARKPRMNTKIAVSHVYVNNIIKDEREARRAPHVSQAEDAKTLYSSIISFFFSSISFSHSVL